MGSLERRVDRLLRRHPLRTGVLLDWHIVTTESGFRRREVKERFGQAMLVDISVDGALMAVNESFDHRIGDRILIRFRGVSGGVEIRHSRPGNDGDVLYGVRFRGDQEFRDMIHRAVGELRGKRNQLTAAWNRSN